MTKSEIYLNPFKPGKIEQEPNPILYVPDRIFDWASGRPMRFEGLRGSGKSSILISMTWKIAWQVSSIKVAGSSKVNSFLEKPTHIGVYYRVEDMEIPYWDRWKVNEDIKQRYFGTYLDFLYLNLLLDALDGIRKKDKSHFMNRQAEKEMINILLEETFPNKQARPRLLEESFSSLRELIAAVHRGIRHLVFQNVPQEVIQETYEVVGPGGLIKVFGEAFINCYPEMKGWRILILVDDCNFLMPWQTVVINTAIANCTHPIVYKVSSLAGLYPTLETMDRRRPLIIDNIETIFLPSKSRYIGTVGARTTRDKNYEIFINGVCKARIEKHYGKSFADKFDIEKLLGPFNLEILLEKKLKDSENDEAIALLKLANKVASGKKPLPITNIWLSQKQVRKKDPENSKKIEENRLRRRQISSVYQKKWSHVAGVSLCKEFRLEFPYCGYKVVEHLSAGSIREILLIMSKIWEEASHDIKWFVKQSPIDQRIQTNGIKRAANDTYMLIDTNPLSPGGSTLQKICLRLGNLFSKCQSFPYILTTPETGSIKTTHGTISGDIEDIIRKGLGSGWLLKKEKSDSILIGLHPILAPKFGISFRNPFYYPEPVNTSAQIKDFFLGDDKQAGATEEKILESRMNRYIQTHKIKNTKQMHLFESNSK